MRSLSTLYRIAYGRIMWAEDGDYRGMCHLFTTMCDDGLITSNEYIRLKNNLEKNRPSEWKHVEFAAEKSYNWDDDDGDYYWFPRGKLALRKKFLQKMINYSKPWYIKLYLRWKGLL